MSRSTLLYYASIGLLVPSKRSHAGYRLYTNADLERLIFIRKCRSAGLSLRDIAELVSPILKPQQVAHILDRRLVGLGVEMEKLRKQRTILNEVAHDRLYEQDLSKWRDTYDVKTQTTRNESKKEVLVVDDSLSMREVIGITLHEMGYLATLAKDGCDPMARIASTRRLFDLVITDLQMPYMDGLALIKELKQRPDYRDIPIVVLGTLVQAPKKAEVKQAGAKAWITKPFRAEQLTSVVERVVRAAQDSKTVTFDIGGAKHGGSGS